MIVPRYYEDLSVLHENTMPARAYFIPASKRMDNLVEHREESDRMQLLWESELTMPRCYLKQQPIPSMKFLKSSGMIISFISAGFSTS